MDSSSVLSLVMSFSLSSLFILEMLQVSLFLEMPVKTEPFACGISALQRAVLVINTQWKSVTDVQRECVTSHWTSVDHGGFSYEGTWMIFEFLSPDWVILWWGSTSWRYHGEQDASWAALLYLQTEEGGHARTGEVVTICFTGKRCTLKGSLCSRGFHAVIFSFGDLAALSLPCKRRTRQQASHGMLGG